MALNFEQKTTIVEELSGTIRQALSVVAGEYRGLTVDAMTQLRQSAHEEGVVVRVYRNTLVRRAIQDTAYACLDPILTGPIVLLFSQENPGDAARLLVNFLKEYEQFNVKGLAINGQLFSPNQLKEIASLPNHKEALGLLASVISAPVTKFVRTLNEPVAQVARVLWMVAESKKKVA